MPTLPWPQRDAGCHHGTPSAVALSCAQREGTVLCRIQEREMLGDSLGLIKFFYFWSKGRRKLLGWACWGFVQGLMPGRDTGL